MSSDYWRKREEDWKNSNKKSEKEQQKQIQEIYMNTLDSITKEIESFFSRYSTSEGISMADAKKKVRKIDIEEYQRKAKKYVAEKNFSDTANAEMKLYNLAMKVNRLELLKANIGLELLDGTNNLETYFGETFNDEVMKELEHNASILGPSVLDNAKSAMVAVNSSFQNATWSERVWNNQAMLKNNLSNIISNALIQGKNARDFIPDVRKQFNVSRYQAERLLRTELARARVQAQAESYAAEDIDEYEYVACGMKDCCSACKKLDGKIFKLKKLEFGVNAPPMHPNCHCATAPYLDRKEFDEWLDGYSEHGLSYEDWKQSKTKMASTNSNNWSNTTIQAYTNEEQKEFVKYAKEKGINLVGIHKFDGDSKLLKQQIDSLNNATKKYPLKQQKKLTLSLSEFDNDDDFAYTSGMNITLNTKILRNKDITERNISNSNFFASPRIQDIVVHEYGHVLSSQYGNRGIELAKKAVYNLYKEEMSTDEILNYLYREVSHYSIEYYGDFELDESINRVKPKKFKEITSEVISLNEFRSNAFTEEYIKNLMR